MVTSRTIVVSSNASSSSLSIIHASMSSEIQENFFLFSWCSITVGVDGGVSGARKAVECSSTRRHFGLHAPKIKNGFSMELVLADVKIRHEKNKHKNIIPKDIFKPDNNDRRNMKLNHERRNEVPRSVVKEIGKSNMCTKEEMMESDLSVKQKWLGSSFDADEELILSLSRARIGDLLGFAFSFGSIFFEIHEMSVDISSFLLIPELHLFPPSSISPQSSYPVAYEPVSSSYSQFILVSLILCFYSSSIDTSNYFIGSLILFPLSLSRKGPKPFLPLSLSPSSNSLSHSFNTRRDLGLITQLPVSLPCILTWILTWESEKNDSFEGQDEGLQLVLHGEGGDGLDAQEIGEECRKGGLVVNTAVEIKTVSIGDYFSLNPITKTPLLPLFAHCNPERDCECSTFW
ncbi:hypothetical protein VP01_1436g1 [Puccinia sorghi]|uniref:Uncharacterized protein n=1 Tax=Puccinia sorghi TaxID=27349 RepID=A0A0L6VKU8_9BASI|nr:hypothetical protein VP01_1436g1 [Puccinia sorghi]